MTQDNSKPEDEPTSGELSRRRLFGWLVGIIGSGVAIGIVAPTAAFVLSPLWKKKAAERWVPLLKESDLAEGEMRAVVFKTKAEDGYMTTTQDVSVYLHRKNGAVEAIDPTCPHLGCHVRFNQDRNQFVCPCHGGVFDENGNRVSGPPPHGLTKLEAKTEAGIVSIREA